MDIRTITKKVFSETVVALIILTAMVILVFHSYIIEPSKLLPAGGDGMKNYFTYLYHIKFDNSYWKFEGMNYPFGENIIFTDNQPILANIVKTLYQIFAFSDASLIQIHNWTIFLGIILGGLGLFRCLRILDVKYWPAILTAVGLILLQPQMLRFQGHFSMVFPFLPWVFYFWLLSWKTNKIWKISIWIGLINVVAGLIHMYHFLTISFLSILAIFFTYIVANNSKGWIKGLQILMIQVVVPFIVLYFISNYIHHVADRPTNPWGFFAYVATWETMFFSYKLPLFEFLNNNITKIRPVSHNEGKNYIGIISAVFFIFALVKLIFSIKKNFKNLSPSLSIQSKLMWIFIASALISFGLPFVIPGLEWMLDYSGPFKQFRGIGRIGWVSFYAINLVAIPYLLQRMNDRLEKNKTIILSIFIFVVIAMEGYFKLPDFTNPPQLISSFSKDYPSIPIDISAYQALLPDPYLHVGSECFGWEDIGGNQDQNFQIGYSLGLQSMGVVMSRNSLSQALLMNELVCKPYKVPDIIQLLKQKDPRPLLVMHSKLKLYNDHSSLQHWTKDAPLVYETNDFELKKLELNAFDTISKNYLAQLKLDSARTEYMEIPLNFEHIQKGKKWGYEAIVQGDSTLQGNWFIQYTVECKTNSDINAIVETWQIDSNHQTLENNAVRSNYNYIKINGNKMMVKIPIQIRNECRKLAVRISKHNQHKTDVMLLEKPVLLREIILSSE